MVYSKRCRSGATFAAGLRWATTYSTAPYILSIDDDGFLCTATLFRLVMSLQYQAGVVIGTWHPGGGSHPDQNFVLLSRDVASNASRRFDAIPRKKTLTVELASFLHSQVHALMMHAMLSCTQSTMPWQECTSISMRLGDTSKQTLHHFATSTCGCTCAALLVVRQNCGNSYTEEKWTTAQKTCMSLRRHLCFSQKRPYNH